MQELLTVIASWLVITFGLPASDEFPRVVFASPAKMAEVRYDRLEAAASASAGVESGQPVAPDSFQDVHAMYDEQGGTIYLPAAWAVDSPADVSVLVHELVHYLQHSGETKFACPQARERLAYQAQARWLELFGTSLSDEFGIDATTILVRTTCVY